MSELIIRPFVDPILGNSSYLVALPNAGLALVIDPQRDVTPYLRAARELNVFIGYALETHLHADFISGARELRAQMLREYPQASFVIGASAGAELGFKHVPLQEGDSLNFVEWTFRVIETPGHTPEHISYLVSHHDKPHAVFSGGSLLVGGAGRTDHLGTELAVPLAHQLYHSIHERLLTLPDNVVVYPTHGAGSFCNSAVSDRRVTTIGNERWNNRFALATSEQEFIKLALTELGSFPNYFHHLREINRQGPHILDNDELPELSPHQVLNQVARGAVVIDLRSPREFAKGHLTGSFGIPFAAPLNRWVGWVVPFGTPLVLLCDNAMERADAVKQLLNIGYDDLRGYLDGITAWEQEGLPLTPTEIVPQPALREWLRRADSPVLLDVRFADEYRAGHLPNARHVETGALTNGVTRTLPQDHPIVIYCRSGLRATVGYSLLERRGFQNVSMLDGGYMHWEANGFETVKE